MIKTLKKTICIILTAIVSLSIITTPAFASSDITIEEFAEEIRAKYKALYPDSRSHYIIDDTLRIMISDPEFVYMFNNDLEEAYLSVEATLNSSMDYDGEIPPPEYEWEFPNPDTGAGGVSMVVVFAAAAVLAVCNCKYIKKSKSAG